MIASYLTKIEAPHYRTLNNKKDVVRKEKQLTLDNLFDGSNRIINLDAIPPEQTDAKAYFEKYYTNYPVSVNKPGRFVQIKVYGIYSYMYEISDDIQLEKMIKGKTVKKRFGEGLLIRAAGSPSRQQ